MSNTETRNRSAAALRVALRARILDAARRIVMRDGLNALSMRKIADAIGYSPASLYLHFESRDEIARALGREGFAQLLAYLEPIAQAVDPGERLRALAHAYVAFGRTHPQAYRLMFMEPGEGARTGEQAGDVAKHVTRPASHPAASHHAASYPDQGDALPCVEAGLVADLFVGALEALAAAGRLRRNAQGDTVLLARALWAMLHGVVAFSLIGPAFAREAALVPIVDAALDGWLDAPAGEGDFA
jgi:AcrR family transcriptional regulator